jgi:hypothetical protein
MASYTREEIIAAIQQATAHDGGDPVGRVRFERLTGIQRGAWLGVYWSRWGEALQAAGFDPNSPYQPRDQNEVLIQVAEMVRTLGKLPSEPELRIARQSHDALPSREGLRSLGSRADLIAKLRELAKSDPNHSGLLALLPEPVANDAGPGRSVPTPPPAVTGQVYLARMGKHYKIGRTNATGRRMYELAIQLPERVTLVHALQTDDPDGIERYWHERFKDKNTNGEWFALSREDVAAFKRRGRFM